MQRSHGAKNFRRRQSRPALCILVGEVRPSSGHTELSSSAQADAIASLTRVVYPYVCPGDPSAVCPQSHMSSCWPCAGLAVPMTGRAVLWARAASLGCARRGRGSLLQEVPAPQCVALQLPWNCRGRQREVPRGPSLPFDSPQQRAIEANGRDKALQVMCEEEPFSSRSDG